MTMPPLPDELTCRLRLLAVSTIVALSPAMPAGGQDELSQAAQRAGVEARALGDQKLWERAEARLKTALQALQGRGEEAAGPRAIIQFSMAAMWEARAEQDPEAAARARDLAVGAYRRILTSFPRNAQAAVNLALLLERLGRTDEALEVLGATERAGSTDRLRLHLARGDLLVRQNRIAEGWRVYWALAEAFPERQGVHERLVRLYRLRPEPDPAQFYEYCLRLARSGFQHLASEGMGDLVDMTWEKNAALAEDALLVWTAQRVEEGRLTPADLERFPPGTRWDSAALAGLRELVEGNASKAAWWNEGAVRRHEASGVLQVRGDRLAAAGQIEDAVALYESAMAIAPRIEEYGEEGKPLFEKPAARLEAASRLARVLHKANDFSGARKEKLDNLLKSLWDEKTQRYGAGDLKGIRQYHQALGAIHTEQKDFAAASYHLNRLLRIEKTEAEQENRPVKPQPQVHLMLASGQEAKEDFQAAAVSRLEASRGYLLGQDEWSAEQSLKEIKPAALDARTRLELNTIGRYLELGKKVLEEKANPQSQLWNQLMEMHQGPGRGKAETEWSQQYLYGLTSRAEIEARQAGDEARVEAWKAKNAALKPTRGAPDRNDPTERQLQNLRRLELEKADGAGRRSPGRGGGGGR